MHELGVATAPIPRRKLSATTLGDAIRLVTTSELFRLRATALGETIRAEDGVGRAVAHFDRWVAPPARSSANVSVPSAARAQRAGR
jgi:hypothetical protein